MFCRCHNHEFSQEVHKTLQSVNGADFKEAEFCATPLSNSNRIQWENGKIKKKRIQVSNFLFPQKKYGDVKYKHSNGGLKKSLSSQYQYFVILIRLLFIFKLRPVFMVYVSL